MLSPDYYWTLGLARYASDADVRKAYVFSRHDALVSVAAV